MRFDELDLSDDILDALDAMRFDECTPIQQQAIPLVLEGRDLIAVAQTGTGKTAAYLLPVIDMLADEPAPVAAVNCIVMAPTRELAQQIDRQMEGFAYYVPVTSVAIYGGTDGATFARQKEGIKKGADVVIATPGRLIAHIQMGYVDLSKVRYFILDEADRMLDMGFYDDIMQIATKLPKERQTLMFSATMPPKIQQLAKSILTDPAEVKIAVSRPTEKIDQSAYVCYDTQKTGILRHLLKTVSSKRVIVFASSKLNVRELARTLRRAGLKAADIHSDLEQKQRDEVMLDYRAGRIDILVATDILARGIDIDDIALVVNYDVPREAEDYVHRIGRTARAGTEGKAVTFVNPKEQSKFGQIERFLGYEVRKEVIPEELGEGPEYKPGERRGGNGGRGERRGHGNHGGRRPNNSHRGQNQHGGKPKRDRQQEGKQEPTQQNAQQHGRQQPKGTGQNRNRRGRRPQRKQPGGARPTDNQSTEN